MLDVFTSHERHWRDYHYVYPVISRRAHGLSLGVNLSPSGACNYDCVYCQVDRTGPRPQQRVDLSVLAAELRELVANHRRLFDEPEFARVPPEYRRLNDIAFSGDGEPTAVPEFPAAARLAADIRRESGVEQAKIVVITNACYLTRPAVAAVLADLDRHGLEIWAKLDAGTEAYHRRVNRPSHTLQHVLDNILAAARLRPVVIQSLFLRLADDPPPAAEIAAYVDRLRWLVDEGGRISLVQVYTVARRPAERFVSALSREELERIAAEVRRAGLCVECFT